MIAFWVVASMMIAGALALLLLPLLGKGKHSPSSSRQETNLSVYRDQLRELDADFAAGTLDETQYRAAHSDLESRVLEDSTGVEAGTSSDFGAIPTSSRSLALSIGIAVALPVMAVALYFWVGTPDGLNPQAQVADATQGHQTTPAQIEAMVAQLEQRLQTQPGNVEGWVMLARSYASMRRFTDSSAAYERAVALVPDNAPLLADYADVLAMSKQSLQGEPERIIRRALKIEPTNLKLLSLMGSTAFERQDYRAAENWWKKMLKLVPINSPSVQSINNSIAEARRLGGMPPRAIEPIPAPVMNAMVSGTVQLDPALRAQVDDTDVVFIFARAAGGGRSPPLAAMRKLVKDLPFTFTLDNSMAMIPNMNLSSATSVVVGARISKTGNVMPSPGDLQGFSQTVKVGQKNILITIDSEVK